MTVSNPLRYAVQIVNADGTPTPQFIRQWQEVMAELKKLRERVTELENGGQ